jgi:hypothetical protein
MLLNLRGLETRKQLNSRLYSEYFSGAIRDDTCEHIKRRYEIEERKAHKKFGDEI